MLTDEELRQTLAIETLFIRFDSDQSGTLEMDELLQMFKSNHINVSRKIIKELFHFADADNSGTISLEEFKALLSNQKALDRNLIILFNRVQRIDDQRALKIAEEVSRVRFSCIWYLRINKISTYRSEGFTQTCDQQNQSQ